MNGVKFDNYHSYNDFHLLLAPKTIPAPSPKTELLEVPGADEMLDFTEFFGDVKYNNRDIQLDFSTIVDRSQFMTLFSEIQNAIHGRRMKIIFDDDPNFYYSGRVAVDEWKADKNIGKISISCDCDPYKYKLNKTVVEKTVSGTTTVKLNNLRRWVTPQIKTTAEITIKYGSNSYVVSQGESTIPGIVLKQGETTLEITGNATVTITYQEAGL